MNLQQNKNDKKSYFTRHVRGYPVERGVGQSTSIHSDLTISSQGRALQRGKEREIERVTE